MGHARANEQWRRVTWSDVPESVRCLIEKARFYARASGASSPAEEWEAIVMAYIHECDDAQAEWKRRATAPDARFRLAVLERESWRCALCGHSKNLEVHHVWSRHELRERGREDLLCDPRVGIVLCRFCHEAVQPHYRSYIEAFLAHTGNAGYDPFCEAVND